MKHAYAFRTAFLVGLLALAACSTTPRGQIDPPDVLYREARESLDSGNYQRAETQLQQIMSHYPFTDFAVQAHLDLLFALLQLDDPEVLAEEADRFIRENPRHANIDYVYYMRGLGFYRGLSNPLREVADLDVARQDVENARTSFRNLAQLVARFPASEYAADAERRMIELRQRIARHEVYVAEYYLRRAAWISALQSAYEILREFPGTPAEIDALIVMQRSYEALGLHELAETPRRILAANPDRQPAVLQRK